MGRTRRAGGIFWAGTLLAAGVLAGGTRAGGSTLLPGFAWPAAALAALAAAAVLLLPRGRLTRRSRVLRAAASRGGVPGAALPLAVCLLCGVALGLRSAARTQSACTSGLPRDVRIHAAGLLTAVASPEAGEASSRAELVAVSLRSGGRRCELPALTVRGDPADLPAPGARVAVLGAWRPYPGAGELRRPQYRGFLRADEVTRPSDGRPRLSTRLRAAAARWRARAASRYDERLPPDAAALARALTLADRGGLPEAVSRRFARAGLAHLLAISGLHVGVLAAAAAWLFGLVLPTGSRHVAAAGLTGAYVLWIGAPPSAVRASLLFAGWAFSRLRGSPVRTSDLLGAAAAAALLADPLTALGPGFQLSFAGFGGVVLGAATGRRLLEGRDPGRRTRGVLLSAAAGAGACALTAPLTALHFQRAAPVAAVSGLLGTPLLGVALLAVLAVLVLPGWAAWAAEGAATGLLRSLTAVVDGFASVPGGQVEASPPGAAYWLIALLLLLGWVRYVRGGRLARCLIPVASAALVGLSWPSLAGAWTGIRGGGGTLVCTLDVGQGDAAAVRTRAGRWILLDAGPATPPGRPGPDEGLSTVVPFLRARGAGPVELLVLSHPDLDHVGGGEAVLERLRVRRVASAGAALPGRPHLRFLRAVREEGARWMTLRAGDRMRVDEVEMLVLDAGPDPGSGRPERLPSNDAGVSLRVRVGGSFAWVTTGDASMAREVAMLRRWPDDSLRADVLSVGHHGSRTSTAPAWVQAVSPALAVISASRGNWFGHPHPMTLATLSEAGVRVLRTDRDGNVCLRVGREEGWRLEE